MPVVTTLHTVPREPRADQRRVMQELISLSTRVVVMTKLGRRMLRETYDAPPEKIDLIAHGIPDVGFVDPTYSAVAWRTPPRQYGAWETVAGNITEGLVARG
jgi:hypothetical protein